MQTDLIVGGILLLIGAVFVLRSKLARLVLIESFKNPFKASRIYIAPDGAWAIFDDDTAQAEDSGETETAFAPTQERDKESNIYAQGGD